MYERVLFPTDASEGAETATEHAIGLASEFDVPLRVLNVVDVSAFHHATDAYSSPPIDPPVGELAEAGEEQTNAVVERAERAGVDASNGVVEGMPANAIADAAEPGDVIVMGTHGRTGLDRYLIGSTTEKVVRTVDVPVVTIPVDVKTTTSEEDSGQTET